MGGFLLIGSLSGGTGSGLGSYFLTFLREEYSNYLEQSFKLLPQIDEYAHPV